MPAQPGRLAKPSRSEVPIARLRWEHDTARSSDGHVPRAPPPSIAGSRPVVAGTTASARVPEQLEHGDGGNLCAERYRSQIDGDGVVRGLWVENVGRLRTQTAGGNPDQYVTEG